MLLLKCLIAAGQEHVLGADLEWASEMQQAAGSTLRRAFYALADMVEKWSLDDTELVGNGLIEGEIGDVEFNQLKKLLKTLAEIEQFYDCIGGIIG